MLAVRADGRRDLLVSRFVSVFIGVMGTEAVVFRQPLVLIVAGVVAAACALVPAILVWAERRLSESGSSPVPAAPRVAWALTAVGMLAAGGLHAVGASTAGWIIAGVLGVFAFLDAFTGWWIARMIVRRVRPG